MPQKYHWIIWIGCLLQVVSPTLLSGDSPFYLYPAVKGAELIHPHHLTYTVFLRGFYLLGSWIGLADAPYLCIRGGMLIFAWMGLWATYLFLRQLQIRPLISALCTLLISVSGLFWQFSTQAEAYIPTYAFLATTAWVLTRASTLPWGSRAQLWYGTGVCLLAVATTMHQAASLAAPALALLVYLNSRQSNAGMGNKKSVMVSLAVLVLSGVLSLGLYIAGWIIAKPGVGFLFWMTKYSHAEGMPWGVPENLTLTGAKNLLRSWGSSWLNYNYANFYDGVSPEHIRSVLAVAAALLVAFAALLILTITKRAYPKHIIWITLWLLMIEGFVWWWTPFLKNFQAIALLPQIALLGLAAESSLSRSNLERLSFRTAVVSGIVLSLALATASINLKHMIVPGLKDRLSPEGDLLLIKPSLKKDDLFVGEFPFGLNMSALLNFNNVSYLADPQIFQLIPDWVSDPASTAKQVFIHRSSVGYPSIALERANQTYSQNWDPVLKELESAAGGLQNLRAQVLINNNGLLGVIFGVSPTLPLTAIEAYRQLATSVTAIPDSSPDAPSYFINRVPKEYRAPELMEKRNAALESGEITPIWDMPFTNENSSPLWAPALDTSALEVTSASMHGKASGRDPVIWTTLDPPRDMSLYVAMEIEATITAPENTPESSIQIFFQMAGMPGVEESKSILVPWPVDGKPHRIILDLTQYPFIATANKVAILRIDPGDIPNSDFRLTDIRFHAVEPSPL